MKQTCLLIALVFLLFSEVLYSQTNFIGDPFLKNGYSTGLYESGKWAHSFNTNFVNGRMGRIANPDFADSLMYCRVSYKTASNDNKESCCFSQKVTGLKPNKYRFEFWAWISTRYTFYTAEISYLNTSLTSQNIVQKIYQSNSTSANNYHLPGNWIKCYVDVDFTGITSLQQINEVKVSIYPNCNNATTLTKSCDYMFAQPKLYAISDQFTEYFRDGELESWNINEISPLEINWNILSANSCIKRAPGLHDTDYGFSIKTFVDNDGTAIETKERSVYLPRTNFKLSFYARSVEDKGEIRVSAGGINLGNVTVTPKWTRYELLADYSTVSETVTDKLKLEFLKANNYYIDNFWLERVDSVVEIIYPYAVGETIYVTTNANEGEGSLREAILNAESGDSIVIPSGYTITLASEIAFDKSLKINGQGSTVQVATPGTSTYRVFNLGTTTSSATTVSLYNLILKGGNITANGGVIFVNQNYTFTMKNCTVSNGRAPYAGGLIMNSATGASVYLENCSFSDNKAKTNNGGACVLKGNTVIKNCIFEGNEATAGNGSAFIINNTGSLQNCTFKNNKSYGSYGGAIYSGATLDCTNCTFESNSHINSTSGAGAFATSTASSPTFTNCTFYNNSGQSAGAVYNHTGTQRYVNCTFAGNISNSADGGAINNRNIAGAITTIVNCIITHNYNSSAILKDLSMGTSGIIDGTNNIVGAATGSPTYTNSVAFSYSPTSDLFALYTSSGNLMPILAHNGGETKTIALSKTGIANGAGSANFGTPNIIPTYDQNGHLRPSSPAVGAVEYFDNNTAVSDIKQHKFVIHPNPASNEVFIKGEDILSVEFYNMLGKTVLSTSKTQNAIDLSNLSPALYFVRINTKNSGEILPLLKK